VAGQDAQHRAADHGVVDRDLRPHRDLGPLRDLRPLRDLGPLRYLGPAGRGSRPLRAGPSAGDGAAPRAHASLGHG
jgi:hypothetical protein